MLRGDGGTAAHVTGGILWTLFPPVRKIVTQQGQDDLDDMGHLRVASPRLRDVMNVFHQAVQTWHLGTHFLYGVRHAQNYKQTGPTLLC